MAFAQQFAHQLCYVMEVVSGATSSGTVASAIIPPKSVEKPSPAVHKLDGSNVKVSRILNLQEMPDRRKRGDILRRSDPAARGPWSIERMTSSPGTSTFRAGGGKDPAQRHLGSGVVIAFVNNMLTEPLRSAQEADPVDSFLARTIKPEVELRRMPLIIGTCLAPSRIQKRVLQGLRLQAECTGTKSGFDCYCRCSQRTCLSIRGVDPLHLNKAISALLGDQLSSASPSNLAKTKSIQSFESQSTTVCPRLRIITYSVYVKSHDEAHQPLLLPLD